MIDQVRYIFPVGPKRWYLNSDCTQPVEKIFTKQSVREFLFKVLIGSGDDSECGFPRRCTPKPEESPCLERAQQLGLGIHIEVAHFIQNEGATARLLELARCRNAVIFGAKQFQRDALCRQGPEIDLDKGA